MLVPWRRGLVAGPVGVASALADRRASSVGCRTTPEECPDADHARRSRRRPQPARAHRAGGAASRGAPDAHAATGRRALGLGADDLPERPRGRRQRPVVRRGDRDLDRDGLAGRLVRLDRHREPARRRRWRRRTCPTSASRRSSATRTVASPWRGQFFPNGTGEATADGYVLNGAWNFGSGTAHSEYIAAGFFPIVDGEAVFDLAQIQAALVHRDDVQFHDGWHVQGLKGTGQLRLRGRGRRRARAPLLPAVHPRSAAGRPPRCSAWG